MSHYENAFNITMEHEGGYTDNGPTYKGIDRRFWPSWSGWLIVDKWSLGEISAAQRDTLLNPLVKEFYKVNFWNRIQGDKLATINSELASKVFDTAVHCGVHQAVKFLQTAVNRLNRYGHTYNDIVVDGVLGNGTLQTVQRQLQTNYGGSLANASKLLLICYTGEQYKHYTSLADHESWPGWFLRLV